MTLQQRDLSESMTIALRSSQNFRLDKKSPDQMLQWSNLKETKLGAVIN